MPESPYPLGTPVTDPRLLQNRRTEIAVVLNAVAPESKSNNQHALIMGEQRSGRTTVLLEVARRASEERGRLVVHLQGGDDLPGNRRSLIRHLLTAAVEGLAEARGLSGAPWYLAWRDRVYLRDTSPTTERDLLSTALVLAANPDEEIDRTLIQRDFAVLLRLAQEAGLEGIVLCVDDASVLTEDMVLVEELLAVVDAVPGCALLLASLPSTAGHFVEAASPCVNRFAAIGLRPFRGPHQIFTSLSAPLTGEASTWVKKEDAGFLRDVLRLTGGNPYELMVVGHYLWATCQLGEQDRYALTPRVLNRVIPHLSLLADDGDALLHGAQAIDCLPDDQVAKAVELVALSRLSVPEIAIARTLKVGSRDADRVDRGILRADLASEKERVLEELERLQEIGVIQLNPDREVFNVVGGRAAEVLLKYTARARIGEEVSGQPFELGFVHAVGRALARDATSRTIDALEGSTSLGFSTIFSENGAGRLSPRPAIRNLGSADGIGRLAQAEVDLIPWDVERYERIAELLAEEEPSVALVCTAVTRGRQELEYTELWELAPGLSHEDLANAWSGVTEEWEPVLAAADLGWGGSEFAFLHGQAARQALIVLQRYAAISAVHSLFERWYGEGKTDALPRAQQVADEAVETMRATDLSESELGGELSGMLSRAGFLKSFDDKLLDEARYALEEALRIGQADSWVTQWNLANVAARQGDAPLALEYMDKLVEAKQDWGGSAFLLVFVPDRKAKECLVRITDSGVDSLVRLQRAVIAAETDPEELAGALEECRASEDPGAVNAAEWVSQADSVAKLLNPATPKNG